MVHVQKYRLFLVCKKLDMPHYVNLGGVCKEPIPSRSEVRKSRYETNDTNAVENITTIHNQLRTKSDRDMESPPGCPGLKLDVGDKAVLPEEDPLGIDVEGTADITDDEPFVGGQNVSV